MNRILEFRALTGIRGVAAVYVMIFHFLPGVAPLSPMSTFLSHGYLSVDLFFVLSGFVMAANYAPMFAASQAPSAYWLFLGRRLARVYPLYAAMTLVAFLLVPQPEITTAPSAELKAVLLSNLLMIQSWFLSISLDGPAWSISAEWAVYLIFPLLLLPSLFWGRVSATVLAVSCLAAVAGLCLLPPEWARKPFPDMLLDLHEPRYGLAVLRCIPEFILGLIAWRVSQTPAGRGLAAHRWASLVLAGAALLLLTVNRSDFWLVALFPMLIVSLTSERHGAGRFLAIRPLQVLGNLSYSIYLTHILMGGFMSAARRQAEASGWHHGQTIAAVAGILITLPVSHASYHLIERPGRRWMRQLLERRSSRALSAEPTTP